MWEVNKAVYWNWKPCYFLVLLLFCTCVPNKKLILILVVFKISGFISSHKILLISNSFKVLVITEPESWWRLQLVSFVGFYLFCFSKCQWCNSSERSVWYSIIIYPPKFLSQHYWGGLYLSSTIAKVYFQVWET